MSKPIGQDNMEPIHRMVTDAMMTKAREVIGPPTKWEGRCYEIACAFVKHKLATGTPVFGHWTGPVSADSRWANRQGHGFIQHGWVLLPDGKVLDPTRFSFEGVDPYIYMGPNDHYDEGGSQLRIAMEQPCPEYLPPNGDGFPRIYDVDISVIPDQAREYMLALMGGPPAVNNRMLFWLANLAPQRLGEHQDALYEFLVGPAALSAAIPQDNLAAWERRRDVRSD